MEILSSTHLALAYRDAGRTQEARDLLTELGPRTSSHPELAVRVEEALHSLP